LSVFESKNYKFNPGLKLSLTKALYCVVCSQDVQSICHENILEQTTLIDCELIVSYGSRRQGSHFFFNLWYTCGGSRYLLLERPLACAAAKSVYRVRQENLQTSNPTSCSCCVYHIFSKVGRVVADIISILLVYLTTF
jgi:hypothetical protein